MSVPVSRVLTSNIKRLAQGNHSAEALRQLAHALYTEIFSAVKLKISSESFDIFNVFAQNIDCGYTLEPPR